MENGPQWIVEQKPITSERRSPSAEGEPRKSTAVHSVSASPGKKKSPPLVGAAAPTTRQRSPRPSFPSPPHRGLSLLLACSFAGSTTTRVLEMAGKNDGNGGSLVNLNQQLEEHIIEKTPAQIQAELDPVTLPLRDVHFPEEIFNMAAALDAGFTARTFMKLVKIVAQLDTQGILQNAIAEGTRKGFWVLHTTATRAQFIQFACWITAKEGQDVICGLHRKRKLEAKATQGQTVYQLALVEVLEQQHQRYTNEKKKVRFEMEQKIDEVMVQVRRKRQELEAAIVELDTKFYPASVFEEPKEEEVGALALRMYESDCLEKGKRPIVLPGHKLEYARKHSGAVARKSLLYDFAMKEKNREALTNFLANEIQNVEDQVISSKGRYPQADLLRLKDMHERLKRRVTIYIMP